jgi:hypothetical protein
MKICRPEEVSSLPPPRELTEQEIKEAYALARAAFSIEDLLRYTEFQADVAADQVLSEMEESQRRQDNQKS